MTPHPSDADDHLRSENEELKRELEALKNPPHSDVQPQLWRPSAVTLWAIGLGAAILIVSAFLGGYLPMQSRNSIIAAEARHEETALPRVEVMTVSRANDQSALQLPGSMQPVTEAPILARADGYIAKRLADIGDRVKAGQPLAEIDAPELNDQVNQAQAVVRQYQSALEQSIANVEQGKADMEIARITADRSGQLVGKGAVSRQEDDQSQAQYRSKLATMHSLERSVDVQRANVAAAQSNVARLEQMQHYRLVRAPFDGVITQRNVDAGALVNNGSTLLFRIAQTTALRTYVNVPQTYADAVHVGETASLTVSNLPGRKFTGLVARSSNALDPNSRTLLVEIRVPNADNVLLPGMYTQVQLMAKRANPPLLIPSEAMVVRAGGAQVACVAGDGVVRLRKIQAGRDYGDKLEIVNGLREGETILVNPGDVPWEGMKVEPVLARSK